MDTPELVPLRDQDYIPAPQRADRIHQDWPFRNRERTRHPRIPTDRPNHEPKPGGRGCHARALRLEPEAGLRLSVGRDSQVRDCRTGLV